MHPEEIHAQLIDRRIYLVRQQRVMLDSDLAELYGVATGRLNEQVRRNIDRFPGDFAFRLTRDEFSSLISQFATSKLGRGGRRKLPLVFTEHGILMLSSVLRSKRATQVNIAIMRTFVHLRRLLMTNEELARELAALERKYDDRFRVVFDAIRQLMAPKTDRKESRRIGFSIDDQ